MDGGFQEMTEIRAWLNPKIGIDYDGLDDNKETTSSVRGHLLYLGNIVGGLTTFKQETVAATDVNGTTWKDLLDKSTITKPTEICGFQVTVAGAWAGKAQIRITDGDGNKIFPFQDYYEEDTDFTSGAQATFNFPVVVPVADGYKFQFRSSNVGDGIGETLQLNNLDIIEVGN